jgi:hypothetical protein
MLLVIVVVIVLLGIAYFIGTVAGHEAADIIKRSDD